MGEALVGISTSDLVKSKDDGSNTGPGALVLTIGFTLEVLIREVLDTCLSENVYQHKFTSMLKVNLESLANPFSFLPLIGKKDSVCGRQIISVRSTD